MGNRSAFSLEAIHAEVFSRTPKFTSRPELCPAWDSHLTLRQGPKLRKIDMPSESHVFALGKGPGVAYSIPSSLAISLRTDTLWVGTSCQGLRTRLSPTTRGTPTPLLGWVWEKQVEGEREDFQVSQASYWWERCRFSNEASEKVTLYVK